MYRSSVYSYRPVILLSAVVIMNKTVPPLGANLQIKKTGSYTDCYKPRAQGSALLPPARPPGTENPTEWRQGSGAPRNAPEEPERASGDQSGEQRALRGRGRGAGSEGRESHPCALPLRGVLVSPCEMAPGGRLGALKGSDLHGIVPNLLCLIITQRCLASNSAQEAPTGEKSEVLPDCSSNSEPLTFAQSYISLTFHVSLKHWQWPGVLQHQTPTSLPQTLHASRFHQKAVFKILRPTHVFCPLLGYNLITYFISC